jgi:hypothetical protein
MQLIVNAISRLVGSFMIGTLPDAVSPLDEGISFSTSLGRSASSGVCSVAIGAPIIGSLCVSTIFHCSMWFFSNE